MRGLTIGIVVAAAVFSGCGTNNPTIETSTPSIAASATPTPTTEPTVRPKPTPAMTQAEAQAAFGTIADRFNAAMTRAYGPGDSSYKTTAADCAALAATIDDTVDSLRSTAWPTGASGAAVALVNAFAEPSAQARNPTICPTTAFILNFTIFQGLRDADNAFRASIGLAARDPSEYL